jgi:hypothetical protein
MRRLVLALTALVLAGCASGDFAKPTAAPGAGMVARIMKRPPPPTNGAKPIAALSREAIGAVDHSLILASVDGTGAAATLRIAAENGGYQTWLSSDRSTVTTRRGVVSATRGLMTDLLASEVEATADAVHARRASSYARSYRYTGGNRNVETVRYDCTLTNAGAQKVEVLERSHATTQMVEVCSGPGGEIRNDYWVGDGIIWKSRQYLEPALGYLNVDRLIR